MRRSAFAIAAAALVVPFALPASGGGANGDLFPIWFGPDQTLPGVATRLTGTIMVEDAAGGTAFDLAVLVDGATLEILHVPPQAPWSDFEFVTAASFVPTGVHRIALVVDPTDAVDEWDEANNLLWDYPVLFSDLTPDLQVEIDATRVAGTPVDRRVEVDVEVCNVGTAATTGHVHLYGWIDRPAASFVGSPDRFGHVDPPTLVAGACFGHTFSAASFLWVGEAHAEFHAVSDVWYALGGEEPFAFETNYADNTAAVAFGVAPVDAS